MHVILNNLFVSFGVIFFIASCNNNPVNSNKDGEIIFDHINFDIGITDKEIGLYTIFEYQFFGIFTDERIESDFDTLAAKCFYYCVTDTVIY